MDTIEECDDIKESENIILDNDEFDVEEYVIDPSDLMDILGIVRKQSDDLYNEEGWCTMNSILSSSFESTYLPKDGISTKGITISDQTGKYIVYGDYLKYTPKAEIDFRKVYELTTQYKYK